MAQLNSANIQGNLRTTDYIKEGSKKLDNKFCGSKTTSGAISNQSGNNYVIQLKDVDGNVLSSITLPQ